MAMATICVHYPDYHGDQSHCELYLGHRHDPGTLAREVLRYQRRYFALLRVEAEKLRPLSHNV